MKKFLKSLALPVRKVLGLFMVCFALALALTVATGYAMATGDTITTATSTISGYWDAIVTIATAVVLFVIGRRVLRKI